MKPNIHPDYRTVVFHDTSIDKYFLVGSTLKTSRTIEWEDGKTYPYYTLEVSSHSHPFYTGKQQVAALEGRVANFNRRFGKLAQGKNRMKVVKSLKSAKSRHPDCQIVKRKGRLYVICKTNPRFKAVQR